MPVVWIILGIAGLSGIFWLRSAASKTLSYSELEYARQGTVEKAQELLAFFQRNQGLTLNGSSTEQNQRVRQFQIASNKSRLPGYLLLRTDGVWDTNTGEAFKQLTGYTPPQRQITTSGYVRG